VVPSQLVCVPFGTSVGDLLLATPVASPSLGWCSAWFCIASCTLQAVLVPAVACDLRWQALHILEKDSCNKSSERANQDVSHKALCMFA